MEKSEDSLRDEILEYAKRKYSSEPEYLWKKFADYAVLRHTDNSKWYGLIMNIPYEKINRRKYGNVDILDVKLDDVLLRDMLIQKEGYYTGYHISRGNWISVVLDGTVNPDDVKNLLDLSFKATASKKKKLEMRPPKEWIVPANPKYYDIIHAFDDTDTIDWKQSTGIKKNDTVFIYVGAPVSAILYKCRVTEIDIPYEYHSSELTISKLMKLKLQKKYQSERFTFDKLKREYGIFAVRGPRSVPDSLSSDLKLK